MIGRDAPVGGRSISNRRSRLRWNRAVRWLAHYDTDRTTLPPFAVRAWEVESVKRLRRLVGGPR